MLSDLYIHISNSELCYKKTGLFFTTFTLFILQSHVTPRSYKIKKCIRLFSHFTKRLCVMRYLKEFRFFQCHNTNELVWLSDCTYRIYFFLTAARLQEPSWLVYGGSSLHGNSTLQYNTQRWLCLPLTLSPTPTELIAACTITAASHYLHIKIKCHLFLSLHFTPWQYHPHQKQAGLTHWLLMRQYEVPAWRFNSWCLCIVIKCTLII